MGSLTMDDVERWLANAMIATRQGQTTEAFRALSQTIRDLARATLPVAPGPTVASFPVIPANEEDERLVDDLIRRRERDRDQRPTEPDEATIAALDRATRRPPATPTDDELRNLVHALTVANFHGDIPSETVNILALGVTRLLGEVESAAAPPEPPNAEELADDPEAMDRFNAVQPRQGGRSEPPPWAIVYERMGGGWEYKVASDIGAMGRWFDVRPAAVDAAWEMHDAILASTCPAVELPKEAHYNERTDEVELRGRTVSLNSEGVAITRYEDRTDVFDAEIAQTLVWLLARAEASNG
jgi:hypothetical protein